jgi:hypothetical protein
MRKYTDKELGAVIKENLPLLQRLGSTGAEVRDENGEYVLLLKFHPLTLEVEKAVRDKFGEYPLRFLDFPMARFYAR